MKSNWQSGNKSRPWSRSAARSGIIGVVVTAAFALVAGCTGGAQPGPGNSPGTSSPGAPVEITYALWNQDRAAAAEEQIKAFETANPDIKVRLAVTPWDDYWTKLQTAVTGGAAPDVFWMNLAEARLYAESGVLLPLSDRIPSSQVDLAALPQSIVEGYFLSGQQWAIPLDIDSIGVCYNKTHFDEAGVAHPDDDWSWSDLIEAAQKLTPGDGSRWGIAAPLADQQGFINTVLQAGGTIYDKDGRSGFGTPESNAGIQFWIDLIYKYKVSPSVQQMADTDPLDMLTSGLVSMVYCGSWTLSGLRMDDFAVKNIDVAPMPKGKVAAGVSNGLGHAISATTKYPDAAWKFVEFLSTEEAADIGAKAGGAIPAYNTAQQVWVDANPDFNGQVFLDALKYSISYPVASQDSAALDTFVMEALLPVWLNERPIEEVGVEIAAHVNEELGS